MMEILGSLEELNVRMVVMWVIGAVMIDLAIRREMEPTLLLPMGFGCILCNLPNSGAVEVLETLFQAGVANELFPLLLFIGIGAMIDFGPLLADPKLLLFGAAAQFGIFFTLSMASLLGVDQVHIDGPGVFHRGLYGLGGDFVEFDAAGAGRVDAQNVGQVPGNGLSFAVRVCCEEDFGGVFGFLADAGEDFSPAADGDVLGFEAVFGAYADLRLGQIPHMALRGFHLVAPAQNFSDGFRLCGRFYDDQFGLHSCPPEVFC